MWHILHADTCDSLNIIYIFFIYLKLTSVKSWHFKFSTTSLFNCNQTSKVTKDERKQKMDPS